MGKIKITKSELDRIIKEEALKFKKAISLKKELSNIEKELQQLNEVEAGKDIAPTGGDNLTNTKKQFVDVSQKAPKFHNPSKNPHTMMEDDSEIEDVDMDVDSDENDGDTIDKAAVLNAIEDLKMALNLHGDFEGSEESEENNDEEVGDDDETYEFDSEESEEEDENGDEEVEDSEEMEDDEIEEGGYKGETHQNPETGEVVDAEGNVVGENLEEPIEGGSPIQKAEEDDVNDNMEKDTRVKAAGDTLMESEKRRMAILAGIMKG